MIPYDLNNEEEISSISSSLKEIALKGLVDIFNGDHEDIHITFSELEIQESLRLVLTGHYTIPVFDMQIILLCNSFPWGRYNYIVDMNFEYIDEVFLIF